MKPKTSVLQSLRAWLLILSQSRLAVNSVTLGDYERPLQISNFIKDLFSGFQLLNLKNDILRKRSDGVKYSVSLPRGVRRLLLSVRGRNMSIWL
jgi:hypothetical protein